MDFSQLKKKALEREQTEAKSKLDAFLDAEAKLEEEHGVEIYATLQYGVHGIVPVVQARIRVNPQIKSVPDNAPKQDQAKAD